MVVPGRGLDDAVAEPYVASALAAGAQKDLRSGRVAVLLQEVVLDLPDHVEAEAVSQLHLFQGILQQLVLAPLLPRAWKLVFVEDAELHNVGVPSEWNSARMSAP